MDAFLREELERSLYVHFPLRVQEERAMETRLLKKKVEQEIILWDGSPEKIRGNGRGEAEISDGVLRIRADCDGIHSPMIRLGIENDGEEKVPDPYSREGFHTVSLKNGVWSRKVWSISEVPRDRLTKLFFRIHKYGKELSASDEMRFEIKDIRMQKTGCPPVTRGWQCEPETVSYSASGYWTEGRKTAVANTSAGTFCLVEEPTGRICLKKEIRKEETRFGTFGILDFSEIRQPGEYRLKFGNQQTEVFPVGERILEGALWRMINFLFCERCGFPVPGKHGTCHQDVITEHNGLRMVYAGGWTLSCGPGLETGTGRLRRGTEGGRII